MRISYITAHTPYGSGEAFVLMEMQTALELGANLTVTPRDPPRMVFHDAGKKLLDSTLWLPLFNLRILRSFLCECFRNKELWHIIALILQHSRSLQIVIKNFAVLPKAVYLSKILKNASVDHIHAHWGTTTATMAWIISELMRTPWSMTLHRWDIAEDNMLAWKVARASFVRCISDKGRQEVLQTLGGVYQEKIKVLHMGVNLPKPVPIQLEPTEKVSTIACPGMLLPVKGHKYLIEACEQIQRKGVKDFQCLIIGDGPLETDIRQQVAKGNMQDIVKLVGILPHDKLLQMYENGEVHAVVLPSIVTEDGEKEGIPVALMEAMAFGIPVISTNTGGIPELLSDGAGLLVKEKDPDELADALLRLRSDTYLYEELKNKGYERINKHFNSKVIVRCLFELMS